MPAGADSGKTSGGGRGRWEAVGGITAVASLVVGIVFGVIELTKEPSKGGDDTPPADERLELVDVEFAADPVDVTVLELVRVGERPIVSAKPGKSGVDNEPYRPLVITLRNPADDPAVLTGVRLTVHEVLPVPTCGPQQRSSVSTSLNFDFRFPSPFGGAWSGTNPQNFVVAAHGVDALSVTMGPELVDDDTASVWRFSVFGVSQGGTQWHWADGLATDFGGASAEAYREYVWRDAPKRGYSEQDVAACAAQRLRQLEELAGQDEDLVVHPGFTGLVGAFREAARG